MRDDFAVFILTHGRPDRVETYKRLRQCGYTGRVYLVIDDEDPTGDAYRARYGEQVVTFSKTEAAKVTDTMDNGGPENVVVYARNAVWGLARDLGVRYFIELDDDYKDFFYRTIGRKPGADHAGYHGFYIRSLDDVFDALTEFLTTTNAATVAMSQGGDHFGGVQGDPSIRLTRKAMNSFVCDATRPFYFLGRLNEDANAYVAHGQRGSLFFTYTPLQINQARTQKNAGGLTDAYLDLGTYVKSFYTVMLAPSCVTVAGMGRYDMRLHHQVRWRNAVPKIVHERHRKP